MKPIERVKEIIKFYNLSISAFEKRTQMSNNSIQTAIKRVANLKDDTLNNILKAFPDISAEWLLTGKGTMFRKETPYQNTNPDDVANDNPTGNSESKKQYYDGMFIRNAELIPLVPEEAFARIKYRGIISMDHEIEKYHVPLFKGAEFLISIKGNAMIPKYSNGDLVACKRVPLDSFLQWNNVYVLSTTQGSLIRRVREGKDDNHILIVSENPEFEPFQLNKSELNAIAIIVGVIHNE